MTRMKAYILDPENAKDRLTATELPMPEAGPGMALIRVRAASLNYRDHLIRSGGYGPSAGLKGTVPLSDGAGEVVAVGTGVNRVKAGDRVSANFFPDWIDGTPGADQLRAALGAPGSPGMLAEYAVVPAASLSLLPPSLSFEEAATLPCAGLTAWHALFEAAALRPGMTVLVQGTGGVSVFALQFAKMAGARVIATSSSDDKLARARALGADHTINYAATPEWDKAAKDYAGADGIDIVVEVGGAGTFEKSISAVRTSGTVAVIGVLSGTGATLNLVPVLWKQVCLKGVYVGSRVMLDRMNEAIEATRLKPVIDKVFPLAAAAEAYAWQAAQKHVGKVVIRLAN